MAKTKEQEAGGREVLTMSGDLTVARIRELHAALSDAVGRAATVEVDVTDAGDVDAAFLQLLCSAHRTAAERGKQLIVRGIERGTAREALVKSGFLRHVGCSEGTRRTCLWLEDEAVRA